ncbi:hypothetical protein ACHAQH_007645 [Verticillium albo-atrum]
MAPTNTGPSSGPLPTTTDFNTLYNRITLASAKQATFLTSMRKKYPSLQHPSAATGTGFSSLTAATPTPAAPGPTKAQIRAAREDDAALRFEPVNAGLGYKPSKAETETDAATRELGRKLLGKRGREQGKDVKRRVIVEESDDDEGRSGVGRRKRARVVPVAGLLDDVEADVEVEETVNEVQPGLEEDSTEAEAARPYEEPAAIETPKPTTAASEAEDVPKRSSKKKQKKKNKVRKAGLSNEP